MSARRRKRTEPSSDRRTGTNRPVGFPLYKQRAQLRWLVVNLCFNLIALTVDSFALSKGFDDAVAIRLLLVTPLFLISIALQFWSSNLALRSLFTGVSTVTFIATIAGLAQFANDAFSSRYLMIATFTLFVTVLFSGLRWRATLATAGNAWILFSIFAVFNLNLQVAYLNIDLVFLCGSTTALALVLRRRQDLQMSKIRALGKIDALRVSELNEANARLAQLSHTDALTGLPNRRHLEEYIKNFESSLVPNSDYGALMIDIDHFKQLNDHSGHSEGDRCLRLVAKAIERNVRIPGDMLARYGGEEFAMILRDADPHDMFATAERIRLAVFEMGFPNHGPGAGGVVTVSIGAYAALPSEPVAEALRQADKMLYIAKASGRNQVSIAASENCKSGLGLVRHL